MQRENRDLGRHTWPKDVGTQLREEHFEHFFEHSLDMLCIADERGYFSRVNSAFSQNLGWTPDELTNRPFLEFVHPEDRTKTEAMYEHLIVHRGICLAFENRYRHRDGSYRWMQWSAMTPVEYNVCYASARDVTDLKLSAERAWRREKREALVTLASGVGHDFNTILTSIVGLSELASGEVESNPSLQAKLRHITQAAVRGVKLVERLFHPSFENVEGPSWFAIDSLILEVVALVEASHPARVKSELKLNSGAALVHGAPGDYHQILMNLLCNAYRAALEQTGRVFIESEWIESKSIVRVAVRDEGPGIPVPIQHRIFDPYFTTHQAKGGRGIGLWLVQRLAEQWGARLEFDTKLGQGTTFTISFTAKIADPG